MKNIIILIIFCLLTLSTSGQNNMKRDDLSHVIYTGTGIDPTWNLIIGYQCRIGIQNKNIFIFTEWLPSIVRFGFSNWDSRIGARYKLLSKGSFLIVNNTYLSPGRVENRNFSSFKIAAGDRLLAGLFNERSYLGLTAEYQKILLSHLNHTDSYREIFYEDAMDGWYKSTGGMFQFGLEGGFSITKNISASADLKIPVTEHFQGYGGSPIHLNIVFTYYLEELRQ